MLDFHFTHFVFLKTIYVVQLCYECITCKGFSPKIFNACNSTLWSNAHLDIQKFIIKSKSPMSVEMGDHGKPMEYANFIYLFVGSYPLKYLNCVFAG